MASEGADVRPFIRLPEAMRRVSRLELGRAMVQRSLRSVGLVIMTNRPAMLARQPRIRKQMARSGDAARPCSPESRSVSARTVSAIGRALDCGDSLSA
jgi:hypothetical protein